MASETSTYNFHSIRQLYDVGPDGPADLHLHIRSYGDDALEIVLENRQYSAQRACKIKKFLILLFLYSAYSAATTFPLTRTADDRKRYESNRFIHITFLVLLLYFAQSTCNLIRSERLLFCLDFALQLQIERFWPRRSNLFISTSNIYDFVINEVIEDLDIHYILIVRTKGTLFKHRSIVAIFNSLRPSVGCLELMYKSLNEVIRKKSAP